MGRKRKKNFNNSEQNNKKIRFDSQGNEVLYVPHEKKNEEFELYYKVNKLNFFFFHFKNFLN